MVKVKRRSYLFLVLPFILLLSVIVITWTFINQGNQKPEAADAAVTLSELNNTFTQRLASYSGAKTPAQKVALLSSLRTAAKDRKGAMVKTLNNPTLFIKNVLPLTQRQKIPKQLYDEGLIEQDATFSGKLLVGHIDGPLRAPLYSFQYVSGSVAQGSVSLGKNYVLYLTKTPSVSTDSNLTIKGYTYPGILVIDSNNVNNFKVGASIKRSLVSPKSAKVLVVLVNYEGNLTEPYTRSEIQKQFFDITNPKSMTNYFKEVSNSMLGGPYNLTGEVRGWVHVSQPTSSCNYYELAELAKTQLGINPANYAAIGYVFPTSSECGESAWTNTPEWFAVSNSLPSIQGYSAHEFGHLLGLGHANFISCGSVMILPDYITSCTNVEYGDGHDLMSASTTPLRHISGIAKNDLGWLQASNIRRVTTPGTYILNPTELSTGVKLVQIPIPHTNEYYAIEYRRKIGFDAIAEIPAAGAVIVRLSGTKFESSGTDYATHSLLIDTHPGDMVPNSNPFRNNPTNAIMGTNDQFIDTAFGRNTGLVVRVRAMSPQAAQIQITFSNVNSCANVNEACAGGSVGATRSCCSGLVCQKPISSRPDSVSYCQAALR